MATGTKNERITGAILAIGGLAFAWYSAESYQLGTMRRMGPGMFPLGLGLILAGLGVAIFIWAPERELPRPDFNAAVAAKVILSIVAFGLLVGSLGLIPAVIATVLIASVAEKPFRPVPVLLLAGFLCILSALIFKVGLGLPIAMLEWPM